MKKLFSLLLLAVSLGLGVIVQSDNALAAGTKYDLKTTFETDESGSTQARYIIEATNSGGPGPTEMVLPLIGDGAKDVVAQYQDKQSVDSEIINDGDDVRVRIPASQSQRWSLMVSYTTDITYDFGLTTVQQVPSLTFNALDIASHSLTMAAELEGGPVAIRGPEPTKRLLTTGRQVVTWRNNQGAFTDTVGLVIGNSGVAEVMIVTELKNDSWWWQTKTVTLPPDTNQQRVWIESISPKPTSVSLDNDGNVLAKYRLMPKQTLEVTAKARISVDNLDYDLGLATSLDDAPQEIKDRYLNQTAAWQDTDIQVEVGADLEKAIAAIHDQVAGKINKAPHEINYEDARASADMMVGELRANQIPARVVLGKLINNGQSADWAWTEVYLPGVGWITLDPASEVISSGFGQTDVRLVGLVLRGLEDDFPPEQLADTTITYVEQEFPEDAAPAPILTSTKHMILPGIALFSVSVEMPAGIIVDDTGVKIGEKLYPLGSLAPLQTANVRQLALAGDAFSKDPVSYGYLEDASLSEELATTETKVSYLVPIVLLGVALLYGLYKVVKLIRNRRGPKHDSESFSVVSEQPSTPETAPVPPESKDATMSVDELREKVRRQVEEERKKPPTRRRPPLVQ